MLWPAPLIGAALLACLSFPLILLGLSHGPLRIRAPGRRFAVAWLALFFAWVVVAVSLGQRPLPDLLAVLLLFATAVVCSFMLWSVLCWGFTLNMLLVLLKLGQGGIGAGMGTSLCRPQRHSKTCRRSRGHPSRRPGSR